MGHLSLTKNRGNTPKDDALTIPFSVSPSLLIALDALSRLFIRHLARPFVVTCCAAGRDRDERNNESNDKSSFQIGEPTTRHEFLLVLTITEMLGFWQPVHRETLIDLVHINLARRAIFRRNGCVDLSDIMS